jgi:hypothetical protein
MAGTVGGLLAEVSLYAKYMQTFHLLEHFIQCKNQNNTARGYKHLVSNPDE